MLSSANKTVFRSSSVCFVEEKNGPAYVVFTKQQWMRAKQHSTTWNGVHVTEELLFASQTQTLFVFLQQGDDDEDREYWEIEMLFRHSDITECVTFTLMPER